MLFKVLIKFDVEPAAYPTAAEQCRRKVQPAFSFPTVAVAV